MTPEHWQKIKNVLAEALEVAPAQRDAYLEQSCGNDHTVRREVELLLQSEQDASTKFLNSTALAEVTATLLPAEDNPWLGRRFGVYKTIEQIGAGGMGEVYRAFRDDDQYSKEVALKVVRAGHDFHFVVTRFKNERQILAGLEHPNKARLLDGGATDEGTPYLVMELIDGRPIGEYCNARKLAISERLALFLPVCAAVQYAHQRLIIHRDIKPGNILVTESGVPKLLDFGIAKILDVENKTSETTLTMYRLLTPQYASPEQVKGEPITTASDVYSLGVVLYELLTGQSPYPRMSGTPQETTRAVCEFEPLKPSLAVRTAHPQLGVSTTDLGSGSNVPSGSVDKLAKQLSGDLDNIILMALRKEPQRRYESVEQFAEDIRRYLANLPVIARKDTPRYRASKFVTRHKVAVAAASAIAVTLVAGLFITLQEARIAKRRFNDVRSLANSLIFDVHDSIKDLPGSTPARKIIVDRALQYLNVLAQESSGDLGLQRELATAYERVGTVQGDYLENNLGDSAGTLASYKKALDIRKQIGVSSNDWNDQLALAQGYRLVAHQQWATGDMRGARSEIGHAIAISTDLSKAHPSDPKLLDELSFDHGVSAAIGYPEDRYATQKIVEDYRQALIADDKMLQLVPDDIRAQYGYAVDLSNMGIAVEASDSRAALLNYKEGLEIGLRLAKQSSELRYQRSVAISYSSIASVYDDLGDYERAAENNMKCLAIYQDLIRVDPKNALLRQGLAITYVNTAMSLSRTGKTEAALDYSDKGLEIMRALVASAPQNTRQQGVLGAVLAARGTILISSKKPDAAIAEFENARSIFESLNKAKASDKRSNVAACEVKIAEASALAGREGAAAEHFHQALTLAEPLISSEPADIDGLYVAADAYSGLGRLSLKQAQRAGQSPRQLRLHRTEARSWLSQSLNTWHRIEHPNHTAPNNFEVGDPATVAKELKSTEMSLASAH